MTTAPKPLRIFCSYSHRDEEYVNDLRDSLRGLERQGLIEWWHDRDISPGWEWEEAIDKNLRTADVILLLVSRAFMASDYVHEKEIGKAVQRHERGEARVIPIIVRPADWEWPPLNKLQAIPRDAKPITTWPNQDEAWLDVVRGIRRAIEELLAERQEQAAKERYREAVEEAWTDNTASSAEAEQLDALASELGLRKDTAADIERDVMGETIKEALERQERKDLEKRLEELYAQARQSHQDQEWQAVVDVFDQIHSEDLRYPDPEGLLASASEALEAQEQEQAVRQKAEELGVDLSRIGGSGADGQVTVQDVVRKAGYTAATSKARSLYNMERYREALELYDQILKVWPDASRSDHHIRPARSQALRKLGREDETMSAHDQASKVSENPKL